MPRQPTWQEALRSTVSAWVSGTDWVKESAYQAVLPHIEAAYQRGLMAGRSQANYPTRRKSKEKPKWYHMQPTDTATAEGPTPASSTDEPPGGSAP
jgi:hypothetical protein